MRLICPLRNCRLRILRTYSKLNLISLGTRTLAYTSANIRLQNPATQIIRICSSHASCVAESIATLTLRHFDSFGYIYLGITLNE